MNLKTRPLSRDTVQLGAENTTKQAGNLSDSEVFSRPNTSVSGGMAESVTTGAQLVLSFHILPTRFA